MSSNQMRPRKIGVMIGSVSDLPQCKDGLKFLEKAEADGRIEFMGLFVNSIHRNTLSVLKNIYDYTEIYCVDAWVIGAGMANHLTGTCDAYLRYEVQSPVPVFGAIFEATTDPDKNRDAAIMSITQVPGNQIIFDPEDPTFLKACWSAVEMEEFKINLPKPKPVEVFDSIGEVLQKIDTLNAASC